MAPRGLIAFDLDGTLVHIGSAWSWIHRLLGTLEAAKPYADQYHRGEINYVQWAEFDVELWHGVPLEKIERAIQNELIFIKNAPRLISTLHTHGFKTAIISSGLSVFADRAIEALGIDINRSNHLVTNTNGAICGVEVEVAYDNKHEILKQITKTVGIPLSKCVAIGDSQNDIPMFEIAGYSIAFNPINAKVASAASITIQSDDALDLLPPLLEFFQLNPL